MTPVSHQQEVELPQLNHLFEVSFVWDERSVSNADVAALALTTAYSGYR
jgi:hypothetical protein